MFFSADSHGSTYVWRKWLSVPEFHKADILILAGDLTGKALVPLVEGDGGSYTTHYYGRKWELKDDKEVLEMEERLTFSGTYPIRCTKSELQELQNDRGKVEKIITQEITKRITEWMDMLIDKVDTRKVTTIVMPGNDDDFDIDPIIKSYESDGIIYPLGKVVQIHKFETASMDYVNPTPWDTPREAKEKELGKKIDEAVSKLDDPSRSIFNFHCPPSNTRLDLAPKLKNLRPVVVAGEVVLEHVGSKSVRKAIEEYRPIMGLHGHIHESYASDKVRDVPVVNPGSEYGEGILRGFIIELTDEGVDKYWKVEG